MLTLQNSQDIIFPDNLESVNQMARSRDIFFVYDHHQKTIWKFNQAGDKLGFLEQGGGGPGEFQKISALKVYGTRLLLCDWARRELMILDRDFKFIRSIRFQGLVRDVVFRNQQFFVVAWQSGRKGMIQWVDQAGVLQHTFGTALEDERMIGLQSGRLINFHDQLIFMHTFLPQIEFYSLNGQLIRKVSMDGFESPTMTFEMLSGKKTKTSRIDFRGLFHSGNTLFFKVKDWGKSKNWLYQFDPALQKFSRIHYPIGLVVDDKGGTYLLQKAEPDRITGMRPVSIEDLIRKAQKAQTKKKETGNR